MPCESIRQGTPKDDFDRLYSLHQMTVRDLLELDVVDLNAIIAMTELLNKWLKGIRGIALTLKAESN